MEVPEGYFKVGRSQALLASAKQWDKKQQTEVKKNFCVELTQGTGFHGISPVQSPALTNFS